VFEVFARNIAYSTDILTVQSGASVSVSFENQDRGVTHDLSFGIAALPHGNTCAGPCRDSYTFTAPAPGTYPFFCTVHADMTGTLVVTR
jgi:plastocyanin